MISGFWFAVVGAVSLLGPLNHLALSASPKAPSSVLSEPRAAQLAFWGRAGEKA